ncbi:MAG: hypothetical protein ACK587_01195 [Cyanobacteriota bacterium]
MVLALRERLKRLGQQWQPAPDLWNRPDGQFIQIVQHGAALPILAPRDDDEILGDDSSDCSRGW